MAVLVMLALLIVVACGTVYESRYNAQVASILVYRTWWFFGILGLLWINILFAALSRIPYKKHHTGFVITHIGLLTLLVGSWVTYQWGIDGQLRVEEGSSSRTVMLPQLSIKVIAPGATDILSFPFSRSLNIISYPTIDGLQEKAGLSVQEYLPAVSVNQSSEKKTSSGKTLNFSFSSQFFNVNETLHNIDQSEIKMGPATIRLVIGASSETPKSGNPARAKKKSANSLNSLLVVKKIKTPQSTIEKINISNLMHSPATIDGTKITLVRSLKNAVVGSNSLMEGEKSNPALELMLEKNGEKKREIVFKNFPTFSLSPEGGFFGLKFEYLPANEESNQEEVAVAQSSENLDRSGNVIEFHVNPQNDSTQIEFYKNNSLVLKSKAALNEEVVSPWMGAKIKINSIQNVEANNQVSTDSSRVKPIEIPFRSQLPPSAIKISNEWIVEGEARKILVNGKEYEIYYGPDNIDLPFTLTLKKFDKVNYPGTDTPMSFQSLVTVDNGSKEFLIKMNEPLEQAKFTLYQSSYEMEPGRTTASILSVNHDPGRWIKYLGAVILVLGIGIFIVMRTSWYNRKFNSSH